ncbi:hypothetical protein SAMN05216524_102633 [Mucilaginibacter sp. OK098]|nr:hypothetical protein SAMN05216524_102633 [Mucilaginibacter sp. OK098]
MNKPSHSNYEAAFLFMMIRDPDSLFFKNIKYNTLSRFLIIIIPFFNSF